MSDGEGLPLQLTTITVAVPGSPLSPSSSMLSSMVAGQVTPLTVPVSQTDCTATVKWKYEQPKTDKVGTTLVRTLSAVWCDGDVMWMTDLISQSSRPLIMVRCVRRKT